MAREQAAHEQAAPPVHCVSAAFADRTSGEGEMRPSYLTGATWARHLQACLQARPPALSLWPHWCSELRCLLVFPGAISLAM